MLTRSFFAGAAPSAKELQRESIPTNSELTHAYTTQTR